MDIDIRQSVYKKNKKNKKRVDATLFLYALLFIISCEFQSPEKWQTPGYYTNLSLTLTNSTFSFESLINDSTIFQDSITDVIHLKYPFSIEPKGVPDNVFDINMSSVEIDDLNMDINESISLLPYLPDTTITIPISFPIDLSMYTECIPVNILDNLEFDTINEVLDMQDYSNITLFTIKSISADSGLWKSEIINNLPFEIDVNFSINNGNNILYSTNNTNVGDYNCTAGEDCNVIISSKQITDNDPETINLESDVNVIIDAQISSGQENNADCSAVIWICPFNQENPFSDEGECKSDCPGNADCVPISENGFSLQDPPIPLSVELILQYEWYNISSIVVDFAGVDNFVTMGVEIPSFDGIDIYKAKIDTASTSLSNNILSVDMTNSSSIPIDFQFNFLNIYTEIAANEWEVFSDSIIIGLKDSLNKDIDFSEKMISNGNPNNSITTLSPIDSIKIELVYSMGALENDTIYVENNIVSLGVGVELSIEDIDIEYIGAIADSLEFPIAESPIIDNIPTGFTDIILEDFTLDIDLFNEIGIPVDIGFNLYEDVVNNNENISVIIEPSEIGYPYYINHDCSFSNIRDTARTLIKLNNDSQIVEYYCDITGDITYIDPLDTSLHMVDDNQSTVLDLVNATPEKINISGSANIEGEGIIYKGAKIWGNANLLVPLSFIFSDSMTIVPAEYTSLAPMDSSMVEQLNTSIIEVSFKSKIINASPLGGNVSILISDSTIFPSFIDSLITGSWVSQEVDFNTNIWGGFPPDSIYVKRFDGSDDNFNSRVLEAIFFHYQHSDTINYFIGRLFDAIEFSTTDSIDYELGYILPEFSEENEYIYNIYNKQIQWIVTVETRNITPIFTLYKTPDHPNYEDILSPITLQTTNFIDVQSIISILFSPNTFEKENNINGLFKNLSEE